MLEFLLLTNRKANENVMGIIIGNVCCLLAMVTDTISSSCKTAKKMLAVQIVSQFFYGASAIALKGYSAAVQNAVTVLRNLAAIKDIKSKWIEWILVIAAFILGLAFNNLAFIGLLPVFANLIYSLAVFRFKDNERALKGAFIINLIAYAIFHGALLNIVGVVTNSVLVITTVIFLIRDTKRKKESEETQQREPSGEDG